LPNLCILISYESVVMGVPFKEEEEHGRADHLERSEDHCDNASDSNPGGLGEGVEELWEDPSTDDCLTSVFEAAEAGDADCLLRMIPHLDVSIDTWGPDSDSALHLAALYGHEECVQVLLSAGALPSVVDCDGAVPLHDAAAGGYTSICEMLLAATAPEERDVNRQDAEGDSPLHNAARGGHLDTCTVLVTLGADPTMRNAEGKTPAMVAGGGPVANMLEGLT
jgi:ankyrin repeat protein